MSMITGYPFTPIISFICSFFILSILDFLANILSTAISVDKILFISLVEIYHSFNYQILFPFSFLSGMWIMHFLT